MSTKPHQKELPLDGNEPSLPIFPTVMNSIEFKKTKERGVRVKLDLDELKKLPKDSEVKVTFNIKESDYTVDSTDTTKNSITRGADSIVDYHQESKGQEMEPFFQFGNDEELTERLADPNDKKTFKKGKALLPLDTLVRLPKDWLKAPIFLPGKQKLNRKVEVMDHRTGLVNVWTMGIDNPLAKVKTPSKEITFEHIKVAFAVLTFWKGENPVPLSVKALAKRVANSTGGSYFRDLLDKLNDLREFWVAVNFGEKKRKRFPLLQEVVLSDKPPLRSDASSAKEDQEEMMLDCVRFDKEFANLLKDLALTMHLRFDAMKELKSGIAQSIYLFLPSRAVYYDSQEKPFEITTALLWEQLHLDKAPKSRRYQILTKDKVSIIAQLDGAKLLTGRLRVVLVETVDKKDWKFLSWVEKKQLLEGGKLRAAWLAGGRTEEEFKQHIDKIQELDNYEIELLESLKIDIEAGFLFFCHAKALLGQEAFQKILSEAKARHLEGTSTVKSWEAVIRHRIDKILSKS